MWKDFFKERCVLNSKHLGAIKHGVSWNTLAVGGATGEALLRIEALLRRLRPMGDDELRMVWLPVKGRTKEWLQVACSEYEGRHFLQLRLQEAYIMSLSYDERKSEPETFALDYLTEMLTQIEGYLRAVVEGIEKDASGYNAYVEANLDPVCRKGYIPIRTFSAYCPLSVLEVDRKDEVLALLQDPPTPYKFDVMTLRTYRKIRRIAHVYGGVSAKCVGGLFPGGWAGYGKGLLGVARGAGAGGLGFPTGREPATGCVGGRGALLQG